MDASDEPAPDESKTQRSGHARYFTVLNIWHLSFVGPRGRVELVPAQELVRADAALRLVRDDGKRLGDFEDAVDGVSAGPLRVELGRWPKPDAKLPRWSRAVPGSSLTDRSPWWLSLSLITTAYLVAVWVGLRLVVRPEAIAIFWPASGPALGALLLMPTRRWPALLAAWFVVHAGAELALGLNVILAFAYPAIALAEVTLGASLIRRTTRHESLAELNRRGLLALTGWMTLVAAPLSAVAAAALHHQMLGDDFLGVALHWWSAEVVGELVVAPALLTASSLAKWWVHAGLARRIEGGVGTGRSSFSSALRRLRRPPIRTAGPGGPRAARSGTSRSRMARGTRCRGHRLYAVRAA